MLPLEIETHMDGIRSQVEQGGIQLLDVQFRRGGSRAFLTFVIDKTGGVTLDDCADVNRRLSAFLDDFFQGSYYLEVNSPGLDRPLKTPQDFSRLQGLNVRVAWKSPNGAGLLTIGRLINSNESEIELETKEGGRLKISFGAITKASREIKI